MNDLLPILVWLSLWAAVLVFGFMIVLYLFLMLMGREELGNLREEADGVMRDVREGEERERKEKVATREARRKRLRSEAPATSEES